MGRPDYAFATATHVVRAEAQKGLYRAEPGGWPLELGLETQQVPPEVLSPSMERAVSAWLLARGQRLMRLNGRTRPIHPRDLDTPVGPSFGPRVRRVVSLAASNTEIVAALGATDRLVAVDSGSDWPPAAAALPRLGPELYVDAEALAALKPDLVLASLSVPGMERNIAALEGRGLPLLVLAPLSLTEIAEDLERVGAALGISSRAADAARGLRAELAALQAPETATAPTRVFIQWWPRPMISPTRNCWSNGMLALAGGVNVFAHLPGQSMAVENEQVCAADPEVILLSWCGVPGSKLDPSRVLANPDLAGVAAVRQGRVYALEEALVGRPGPRVVQGVARMAALLRGR